MYRIRKELFENPEIGLKENMASELLAAMFREEGFSVIKGIYLSLIHISEPTRH